MTTPALSQSDRSADRLSWGLIALLAFTGLLACFATLPLIWDGAYQFANTLQHGRPHVYVGSWQHAYQGRFHTWFLWWPVVWASKFTDHPLILQAIYGMPFLLAPAFSLAACWWIVRKQSPGLMLWALFGIAIGPLPGQCFAINDSILLHHLLWPIFVAMFVGLSWPKIVLLSVLAFFQLAQPMGIANCVGAAIAGVLVAWARPDLRRRQFVRAGLLLAVAVLGVARLIAYPDSQAADEASPMEVIKRWHNGVEGLPLAGMIFFWLAALAAGLTTWIGDRCDDTVDHRRRREFCNGLGWLAVACATIGAAFWAGWAMDEQRWRLAVDYRRFVLPLSLPFFLAATIEGVVTATRQASIPRTIAPVPERRALPIILAATFAVVLVIQSSLWFQLVRRLRWEVNSSAQAVVHKASLPWTRGTALDHWSLPTVYLAIEGRHQHKALLFADEWAAPLHESPPRIPIVQWESYPVDPGAEGYYRFDLQPRP
ncbi:hypothetical protein [Humisphaera borealis]|uniref:Uncharacterized protein n=1 Tax=Humisphaera borealis TaxID=2807512 RepID=A0A7M2WXS3_9BACT|nr:hypothetical protein [Humisphaera borealis]QOV90285.1 hypothetical protein IPV69_02620 [Humisphaera borealis]